MIGTYGSVLAICVAAFAIGRGVFALTGATSWNWLAPAVGYAALLVLCESAIRLPGHGWTAVVAVGVVVVGAVLVGRRPAVTGSLVDGLVTAAAILASTAVPFVASGRIGVLGVSFLNDSAVHLLLADGLLHPEARAFTNHGPPGYPSGPHAIMATTAQGLGFGLDETMTGLLVATAVLTGLTALAALEELPRAARWLVATLAAILYLSAAWYAQGAFKEPIVGMLLLALVLLVLRGRHEGFVHLWSVAVPAAMLMLGIVYAYSYTGLVWPAAFLVIWGGAELALFRPRPRRLVHELRVRAAPLSAGVGLLVLGVTPEVAHVHAFVGSLGGAGLGTVGAIAKTNIGNLVGPLSARESLGIWLQSDFRYWPSDLQAARVLSLFALGVLLLGVARELANRELAIPSALLACAAVYVYSRQTQSPYVAAKALVVPAPLVAVAAGRGLFRLGGRARARAVRIGLVALALPFLLLAFGSSFMALRGADVGPPDHARELQSLARLLDHSPTLVLLHDDFYQYELLPVPTTSPPMGSPLLPAAFSAQKPWQYGSPVDFDSVDTGTLDRFDHVITARTAYQSDPPPNFHLEARTRSYDVWRRRGPTRPRRVLPEAGAPGAVLDCGRRRGREIARARGIARVRARPVVQALNWALQPGHSGSTAMTLPAGTWELSLLYTSPFRVRVSAGPLRTTLPANLDRPGAFWRIGDVRGSGRPLTVSLTQEKPTALAAPSEIAVLATLAAVKSSGDRTLPLSKSCGKYVDWYRMST